MDMMYFDYLISHDGAKCYLSGEYYELTADVDDEYKKGDRVKLIGGVDGRYDVPGYHFSDGWVTVSKVRNPANFVGVKRADIKLITKG